MLRSTTMTVSSQLFEHPFPVRRLCFSPDGNWIAVGGSDRVELYRYDAGRPCPLVGPPIRLRPSVPGRNPRDPLQIAFPSGWGDHLMVVVGWTAGEVQCFRVEGKTATVEACWTAPQNPIRSLSCSAEGRLFATVTDDRQVTVWDDAGEIRYSHDGPSWNATLSPMGDALVFDDHSERFWDLIQTRLVALPHGTQRWCVETRGQRHIAFAGDRVLATTWSSTTLHHPVSGKVLVHLDTCLPVAISLSRRLLVSQLPTRSGIGAGELQAFDLLTGVRRGSPWRVHDRELIALAIHPDGQHALTSTKASQGLGIPTLDGTCWMGHWVLPDVARS